MLGWFIIAIICFFVVDAIGGSGSDSCLGMIVSGICVIVGVGLAIAIFLALISML